MTKLVPQPSSSAGAADQQPLPEGSEQQCGDDDQGQSSSPQASSTPAKGTTTPTSKRQPHQPPSSSSNRRRTSTRLTSIRNDSLSSSSSSSSLSSSAADLESTVIGPDVKSSAPDEDVFKVPSVTPGIGGEEQPVEPGDAGIICRLPLDRLQAILGALNILKGSPDSESGASNSPSPSPTYKMLCLYCDRTFASQTLMAKHIDRVHRIPKDRRSSSRVVPAVSDGAFPSCSYCNKGKVLNPASEDLSQLFKHLIDQHSDRYFACEACALRFATDESRDSHMEALHQPASSETRTRPKSKAALKSFNLNKMTKKCDEIVTTPLTIQVDFDTEAIKNLTIENIEAVDSLSAALGIAASTSSSSQPTTNSSTRLRSSGRTSARSGTAPAIKSKVFKKSDKMLMRSSEPTLSRLGIAQHRTPRQSRRVACAKNRRKPATDSASCSSSISGTSSSQPDNHYNKITKLKTIRSTLNNPSGTSETDFVASRGKNDIASTYDEDFYENVNSNVRQNLSAYLDGKLEAPTPNAPSSIIPVTAVPAIRSTVVKSPLHQPTESKIHEATNLPAVTVFPTLLTVEQFGTDFLPSSKMKKPITKNSWKWKWDFVKKYKYVNENGRIVKKVKQPTLGLRDLSKLDMWTQLTMRTKHELIRNRRRNVGDEPATVSSHLSEVGDALRQEQRKQVNELNQILDSRLLPQINLEQHDQSIIKLEAEPLEEPGEYSDQYSEDPLAADTIDEDFIATLQLLKLPNSGRTQQVILSGEWARPRCYICYCCGDKFNSLKQMEEHKTFRHPYVYSTYYEIVGRELIEKQLFKHFFIPLSALTMHRIHYSRLSTYPPAIAAFDRSRFRQPSSESTATITEIKSEDSSSNEATSFSTTTTSSSISSANTVISSNSGSSSSSSISSRSALDLLVSAGNDYTTSFTSYPTSSSPVRCSKCSKECVNTLVLYAHILNCTNDYIWLQAKKRMKYRRANRRRKGCSRAAMAARKAQMSHGVGQTGVEKSETASNHSGADGESSSSCAGSERKKKPKSSPPRPKENDSDIVRRLTANLPAKRISRQILQMTKIIRKRPQINIVKGKKQVVSTLAPSKAGVPRGGASAVALKLRSGKIATVPSSTKKKLPVKVKAQPKPPVVKEEEAAGEEGSGDKAELTQGEVKEVKQEDTKEEQPTEKRVEGEGEKEEEKEQQRQQQKKKKKVVVPRGRILPVRGGNAFGNRGMQWKGKKVLPYRKGLAGNGRTLRSGVVKALPSVGMRKIKAKSVTPTKKESPEKEEKEKEKETSSPVSTKKNVSKRKGSKSPMEVGENNPSKRDEGKQEPLVDAVGTEEVSQQKNGGEEIVQKNCDEREGKKDTNGKEDLVTEEVPKEGSKEDDESKIQEKPTEEKLGQLENVVKVVKEVELNREEVVTPKAWKVVQEETPEQPVGITPVTPVKSPSVNSQSPLAPLTPSCLSNLQANKRKPKKLNDCIAMLTGKLSEKLGVDFFNQAIGKNSGLKNAISSVETRASKQLLLPAPNMIPLQPPIITAMPLQITPPQLAPLPLVTNSRRSSVSSQPPPMLSPVSPIVASMDEISDEPLNLSKNSPIGRSVPPRTRDMYNHQRSSHHMSPPPPPSPTSLHSPHQLSTSMRHPSPQPQPPQHHPQHQQSLQNQPGPSTPTRNLPSIKLPPGLIIERVEYKSRPVISKEAPSVTIVARRQPPPSMESRSSAHPSPPEPSSLSPQAVTPVTRRQSIHQQQQLQQPQQLYGDPRKITPPSHQPQQQQLPSPKQPQQPPQYPSTPSIASTLRQERPLENRISVTVTEAKKDHHHSPIAKQPPITLNIPERLPVLDRTPPPVNASSSLIIPTVLIPNPPQPAPSTSGTSKRSRRKSVFVSQTPPISETQSSAPAPPIPPVVPPAPVVPSAFLPGPFPLFPHSLLAGPPLGLDLQRLAAVGLPPHLKPPAIPPLSVPAPHAPSTSAAAALLEKLFLPNRELFVKHLENAAAAAAAAAAAQASSRKSSEEAEVPIIESSLKDKSSTSEVTVPAPPEKKGRSRARGSKAKAQSVIVSTDTPPAIPTAEITAKSPLPVTDEERPPSDGDPIQHGPVRVPSKNSPKPTKDKTPPRDEHPRLSKSPLPEESTAAPLSESMPSEFEPESTTPTPTSQNSSLKTVRKRRKNELAAILSDQLLESFKEVDQNALQDLKMMHDMSCEKPDIKFSLEQIPQLAKRKVNIRHPDLLTRQSPVASGKKLPTKKGGAKDQADQDQTGEEVQEKDNVEDTVDDKKESDEREKKDSVMDHVDQVIQEVIEYVAPVPVVEDVPKPTTAKKSSKKLPEKAPKIQDIPSEPTETEPEADKPATPVALPPVKAPPKRRTRKLSIDIERIATLDRKGRQNLKAKYSKQLEGLDIAEQLRESPTGKKTKPKATKKDNTVSPAPTEGETNKLDDKPQETEKPLEKPTEKKATKSKAAKKVETLQASTEGDMKKLEDKPQEIEKPPEKPTEKKATKSKATKKADTIQAPTEVETKILEDKPQEVEKSLEKPKEKKITKSKATKKVDTVQAPTEAETKKLEDEPQEVEKSLEKPKEKKITKSKATKKVDTMQALSELETKKLEDEPQEVEKHLEKPKEKKITKSKAAKKDGAVTAPTEENVTQIDNKLQETEKPLEKPTNKKNKAKTAKKVDTVKPPTEGDVQKIENKPQEIEAPLQKSTEEAADKVPTSQEPVEPSSKKKSQAKSRSKTPFPYPKEALSEKTDLERLKDSLNIETPKKKPAVGRKKQAAVIEESATVSEQTEPIEEVPQPKKTAKRKGGKVEKEASTIEPSSTSPSKKKKQEIDVRVPVDEALEPLEEVPPKAPSKRSKTPASVAEKPTAPSPVLTPPKTPTKRSKTPAPVEEKPTVLSAVLAPPKTPTKRSKTPAPVEEKPTAPPPAVTPLKTPTKRSKTPAPVEEKPTTPSPVVTPSKTPAKRSKTPAPVEEKPAATSPVVIQSKTSTKRSKTPAPAEDMPTAVSPVVTPTKVIPPTPPKRIMARRSSVFVDRNLAQYLEERDAEQELLSHSSFKDDLILTSRRGTRSQGTVDLDLVQSFAEAAMKPRDPRRRSAAAVAAAAASAKRAEEERRAADEERKRREEEDKRRWEEEKRKYEEEEERKKKAAETTKPAPVLRRISARRASLFIAPPPEIEEPKVPEENIAEIGKATKRQYRRRASVYQSMSFLDEEEQREKQKEEERKANAPMRSKTPGPGGIWDQDIKTVGRRRNQSSVFNGTPEPTIESLLEPLTLPTTGTKRRTKNSQLAENLSKLFNIEEEIQMIDRSKRKPRKTNTPVAFDAPSPLLSTSTPVKEDKEDASLPKESPVGVESNKIDELVKVVEKEVARTSIAPKPRESLSFSNDDEFETPKLHKLVEDIINKSESESDSDDDNMSLACFVRREEGFLKPQQYQDLLEANVEDESNSAMDDDVSVTTEVTTFGGSIRKRKRRKSICVTKARRPKPPIDESKPAVTFNCDLCKKVFKKQDAYNKHRMTLSHIAKLSEQEYLEAQQKEREAMTSAVLAVQQSTPAQATPPTATGASPQSSIKNLSQEEKLFYECCSMLKESNTADNENLNLTVSLKSDEMASSGMVCDQIPPAKTSAVFPNPFAGLPEQDKTTESCFNMGDSFPSFQDVSESENYIQTINQRYADKNLGSDPFSKLTAAGIAQQAENDGNLSPQNSTKSTSSQASVFSQKTIKTKGALKGYDNFKVSIPMSDIQGAKESKLDTLADVALCGDIPKEFDLKASEEEREGELSSRISDMSSPVSAPPGQATPKSDTSPKNGLQSGGRRAPAKKEPQGNRSGSRAKKKKGGATPTKAAGSSRRSNPRERKPVVPALALKTPPKSSQVDPDDIYAFQDSPPEEVEALPSYSSKKIAASSSSPAIANKPPLDLSGSSATVDQGEDSQLSSLSFSDRDDFVYGTNTLSEEDEDDKSSSYSSAQTTPKKPVKADVQKKSLIMGRIFKKTKDKPKEETGAKKMPAGPNDGPAKPVPKDFDKLFDTLKKSEADEHPDEEATAAEAEQSTETVDPKLLEEYEEDEKGNRKLRRRSTQKKTLTETWDSDEFEDFNLKNVVDLIEKKDGKGAMKKTAVAADMDAPKPEEKPDESPLKVVNQTAKEPPVVTKSKTSTEKKPLVTDETIRQVMESVIMEVSMNKNNRARDNKRRGKVRPSKATSSDSSKEDENVQEKTENKDTNFDSSTSLDEHVLESSVMISSKTITSTFKQKLISSQTVKQAKEEPKPPEQNKPPEEETKKPATTNKTVNNNNNQNQKTKAAAKTKEQRKDPPEAKSTAAAQNTKLKQRKGPPKKMKNVAYDPDSDFEDNIKCKKVKKKLLESDIEANLKIEQLNAQLTDSILMPAPRRKRNAAETLYFWSSSSEEDDLEEDFVEVSAPNKGGGNKKKKAGAAKAKQAKGGQAKSAQQQKQQGGKQQQTQQQQHQHQDQQQQQQQQLDSQSAMEAGDDTSSSSEHMQQHGWIVGDSHKKLVTLLAHAKGKQESRPVKATGNRRKT